MNEEKMQILSMLEKGKISADEAARLLDALGAVEQPATDREKMDGKKAKWLRIHVTENGKDKVKVNMPIKLVQILSKMHGIMPTDAKMTLDQHNIDLSAIMDAIKDGAEGEIVNVEDGNATVKIFVE
jgi:polyhydroxyalkanoate synthesis regulator phasin